MQDFRFAIRQLLKTPGFTSVAVLTLALAIGVNSAIFALINGVVLKPVVPVRPNEVVNVFTARQNASHDYRQFSYNEYRELRENGGLGFGARGENPEARLPGVARGGALEPCEGGDVGLVDVVADEHQRLALGLDAVSLLVVRG